MFNKVSSVENLRPIEVESPQPEVRGRGLGTDSGTTAEQRTNACVQKKTLQLFNIFNNIQPYNNIPFKKKYATEK